jgi:formylglycine-generating enzyme required for sulfatase activity
MSLSAIAQRIKILFILLQIALSKMVCVFGLISGKPWGLYDMHGNVWEWVQDTSHNTYNNAPSDGSAWKEGFDRLRITRGGSWNINSGDCRSACRIHNQLDFRNLDIGFRLVRDV